MFYSNLSKSQLYILCGILAVIVVALAVLIAILGNRKKAKRRIKEYDRKYSYLTSLMSGDICGYIHRLEIISRTNLLYVDKYNNFQERYKDIFENDSKSCEKFLNRVKDLYSNKEFKIIKEPIRQLKSNISIFEKKVNVLDKDLYVLIKPEEDARHEILVIKEEYRKTKDNYFEHSSDLEIMTTSLTKVFEKLDSYLERFDNYVESGSYDEANALVPTIKNVIIAVNKVVEAAPNLCLLILNVLPEKINDLNEYYLSVAENNIPLTNVSMDYFVSDWNSKLQKCLADLKNLKTAGIAEILNTIEDDIQKTREKIDKEIENKNEFTSENDSFYDNVDALEKAYFKMCNILNDLKRYYIIDQYHEESLNQLQQSISKLDDSKRILDNLTHSTARQPYSVLRIRLRELRENYESALKTFTEFKTYMDSLKTSAEEANTVLHVYYYRCKQIEASLREIAIPALTDEFLEKIKNTYVILNDLSQVLNLRPIDVAAVTTMVKEIKETTNSYFEQFENKCRDQQLAESAIVYGNRDRNHQSDVHQTLNVLERNFFQGDFAQVHHEANLIYSRLHSEEKSNGRR